MKNAANEATKGQGLGSTKCQVCCVLKYLNFSLLYRFFDKPVE